MRIVSQYLRITIFAAGLLIGIQLPGFVDQYGKALQSHQREAELALQEFQDDADRFFGGSIERLIEHYRSSDDEVFSEGGDSIGALAARRDLLVDAVRRFEASEFSPYVQTLLLPLADIRAEVVESYTYAVVLKPSAIMVGLLAGVVSMLLSELLLLLPGRLWRRSGRTAAPARR